MPDLHFDGANSAVITCLTHHCNNIFFKVNMTVCWLVNELQWLVIGDKKSILEFFFLETRYIR